MRIGILCNTSSWGGLEMNLEKVSQWMAQNGHEVYIMAPEKSKVHLQQNKRYHTVPFNTRFKYADLWAVKRLKSIIKKNKIKNLIIGHSKDIGLAFLLKRFFLVKINAIYLQQMEIGLPKKDLLHTLFYNHLDTWVCPLPFLKKQLKEKTYIKEKKISTIPLSISIKRFSKYIGQSFKKDFDLSEQDFVIGIIGRFDPGKGQDILLRAAKEAASQIPHLKILFIGEETFGEEGYLSKLKQLTEAYQLKETIIFHPFIQEIEKAFKALDIFVMASKKETFGMVTLEAMASGIPVIGTRSGGTEDLLEEGKTGLFFQPGDATELADKILSLYMDPDLRKQLAQNARQKAQEYDYTYQISALEKLMF